MSDQATGPTSPYQSLQAQPNLPPAHRLRLWPGVALVALMWLLKGVALIGEPSFLFVFFIAGIIGPLVALVGLLLWWLFASRLPWRDRGIVVGAYVAVAAATVLFCYNDFPPMVMALQVVPIVTTAWVGWLVLSFFLSWPVRRAGVLLIFVATGLVCSALRFDGVNGEFAAQFSWRLALKPEAKLLAAMKAKGEQGPAPAKLVTELREQPGDWTGFRGPNRDGRLPGVRIKTDWHGSPPEELWRKKVGPGWSSFAVVGERIFTQEQRGPDEYVVCYNAANGEEVWTHHDSTRFEEMVAGAGPRATPTFHDGRLYTYGANSHLNCFDAASGKPLWSHDVATEFKADAEKVIPQWGFASSPLVTKGLVLVFAGARNGKTLVAYKEKSGELAWTASVGPLPDKPEKVAASYSSPQLAAVSGVEQILLLTDAGLSGFEPASGKEMWHYAWSTEGVPRIVQPAVVGESDVLLGTGLGKGTRRIHVARKGDHWDTEELWTNPKFKPYFNDFVVFRDHLYGFESGKFVCIQLADGKEKWHATGYGSGQVLLLPDQGLLLILSEEGEVALVPAQPEKHEQLAKFKAVEGKTWNHPVVAHGKLFVRNGEEMACFKLGLVEDSATASR
jgi:outer membrane protein assembly factor BamB